MALNRKTVTPEQALARLETLCAASEQCTYDLCTKLMRWGIASGIAEKIIESLVDRRFVDDRRFSLAFARDKLRFNRWGRRKIAAAMIAKRLPRTCIAEAIEQLPADEYQAICLRLLRAKKVSAKLSSSLDDRRKLYAFGISRGFESALVAAALRRLSESGEE